MILVIILNVVYSSNIFLVKEWVWLLDINKEIISYRENENDVFITVDRYWIETWATIMYHINWIKAIPDRMPLKKIDYYGYLLNKYQWNNIFIVSSYKNIHKTISEYFYNKTIKLVWVKHIKYKSIWSFCSANLIIWGFQEFNWYLDLKNFCKNDFYKDIIDTNLTVYVFKMKNLGNLPEQSSINKNDWIIDGTWSLRF